MRLLVLSILSSLTAIHALPRKNPPSNSDSNIDWKPCPELEEELGGYTLPSPVECATLPVPLDYTNDSSCAETLDLALIRVKATKEPFMGSVLFNPGGPGGSGVEYVAQASDQLHETLGANFHLIGFDPRGTGKTIPFDCKIGEDLEMEARSVNPILVETNLTDYLYNGGWEESKSYAESCYDAMKETGEYISTAFVVRDMVNILDALGEDGLLRYWGTSYGTQLGATFAAMFPERVERVLLDGNVNPHDYVSGTYYDTLQDTDNTFLAFVTECVHTPNMCAAAEFLGPKATVADVIEETNTKLKALLDFPDQRGEGLYEATRNQIFSALYGPEGWSTLGNLMASIFNATSIEPLIEAYEESLKYERKDSKPYNEGVDSQFGIQCIDTTWRADSPEEIEEIVQQQGAISTFSDSYYPSTWNCPVWKMKPREAYTGNFTATTKSPILFINGRWDPVTPLMSAFNSSAGFEDSVVLTHNGYGHGLAAHPSLCTAKAIRSFFVNGTYPSPGSQCEVDVPPFEVGMESSAEKLKKRDPSVTDEDTRLLNAMVELNRRSKRRMHI